MKARHEGKSRRNNMLTLTHEQAHAMPALYYRSPYTVMLGVQSIYACGITFETAKKIYEDHQKIG